MITIHDLANLLIVTASITAISNLTNENSNLKRRQWCDRLVLGTRAVNCELRNVENLNIILETLNDHE